MVFLGVFIDPDRVIFDRFPDPFSIHLPQKYDCFQPRIPIYLSSRFSCRLDLLVILSVANHSFAVIGEVEGSLAVQDILRLRKTLSAGGGQRFAPLRDDI